MEKIRHSEERRQAIKRLAEIIERKSKKNHEALAEMLVEAALDKPSSDARRWREFKSGKSYQDPWQAKRILSKAQTHGWLPTYPEPTGEKRGMRLISISSPEYKAWEETQILLRRATDGEMGYDTEEHRHEDEAWLERMRLENQSYMQTNLVPLLHAWVRSLDGGEEKPDFCSVVQLMDSLVARLNWEIPPETNFWDMETNVWPCLEDPPKGGRIHLPLGRYFQNRHRRNAARRGIC